MKKKNILLKLLIVFLVMNLLITLTSSVISRAISNETQIEIGIDRYRAGNNQPDSDGNYPAYLMVNGINQPVNKLYQVKNGTTDYNRAIYCLDAKRGFGEWSTGDSSKKTYNYKLNLLSESDIATIESKEKQYNDTNIQDGDYKKIAKMLQYFYISGSGDDIRKEFINNVLKKVGKENTYVDNDNNVNIYITDKDIELAQQLAIWKYTNGESEEFQKIFSNDSLCNIYASLYKDDSKKTIADVITDLNKEEGQNITKTQNDNIDYYSLSDIQRILTAIKQQYEIIEDKSHAEDLKATIDKYRGMWNRVEVINDIYNYFIDIAEDENINLITDSGAPLQFTETQINTEVKNSNYLIGPFKIEKVNNNEYYNSNLKVTDENGNTVVNYKIVDANSSASEVKVGEDFYIQVPISTSANKIKVEFSAKYTNVEVNYWSINSQEASTQPIAIVDKDELQAEGSKEVELPHKDIDLALRKFISAVNTESYTGTAKDRQPKVDVSKLIPNGTDKTAKYVHTKNPVSVKVGDIVEYTIRVYNEGQVDAYVGKVTDILPEQLTFITQENATTDELRQALEFNAGYGWIINPSTKEIETNVLSKNTNLSSMQALILQEQNRDSALLKHFDQSMSQPDYIDLKVKCIVNEKATSDEKITNIAEISEYQDKDGSVTETDRDSQSDNFPEDKKNNDYEGNGNDNGYVKGQEDDDDFERLVVERPFDLSLRKYISDIDGAPTTGREPNVDVSSLVPNGQNSTAEYNHSKKPLDVVKGSIVTYTIEVFNEGDIDGYVNEITDYLPKELEFTQNSEINEKYKWRVSDDGRTVTTSYLQYTPGSEENLLQHFDSTKNELSSRFVQIQCTVKGTAEYGRIITNLAQITEDCDSEGNEITDRDSVPNDNFILPTDEKLPTYKQEEENKSYVPGQEDDDDYEKVRLVYFDLALRKIVSKAIVIENGEQTVTETNHKFEDDPEEIVKVDLGRKNLKNVTVKFEYKIRITNEGMIEGYAKEVKDYIPSGLIFDAKDNPQWKQESEGVITTDQLKDTLLQPGESAVVSVLLTWKNSSDNMGLKVNVAEISKDYNKYNAPDIDSTPDNKKDGEDDIDDAPVMLSIVLGKNTKTYLGLAITMLITTATGIVLIKKFVI